MADNPVNHPMRPLYRVLSALAGLYVLIFGGIGLAQTAEGGLFATGDVAVLGLRTNLAFAILSVVVGVVILGATAAGRNIDATVYKFAGYGFLSVGLAELAVLRTDVNVLNFSVATCCVSFLIGLLLLMAGMYGRTGTAEQARAAEETRLLP